MIANISSPQEFQGQKGIVHLLLTQIRNEFHVKIFLLINLIIIIETHLANFVDLISLQAPYKKSHVNLFLQDLIDLVIDLT